MGSVQAGVLRGRIFAVSVGSIASLGTLVQCAAAWFKCYKCDGRQKYVTADDGGQSQSINQQCHYIISVFTSHDVTFNYNCTIMVSHYLVSESHRSTAIVTMCSVMAVVTAVVRCCCSCDSCDCSSVTDSLQLCAAA